ncbi:MAG: right-handed parallel beta-helix repeat-containing protein [Pseudomonadales bacterium]
MLHSNEKDKLQNAESLTLPCSRQVITRLTQTLMVTIFLLLHSAFAVSPTEYGAVAGDGLDDTAAIQAAIDNNSEVYLDGEFMVSRTLTLHSDLLIESNGRGGLLMTSGPDGFGNLDAATEYSDNAIGLSGDNVANVQLKNFKLTKQFQDRSNVSAVRIRRGDNIQVSGLDITGFSNGLVIAFDSVRWGFINNNYIHGSYTSSEAQHTAIAIDSSRVIDAGTILNSSSVLVDNNFIMGLKVSQQLRDRNRVETDGINIAGPETHDIWLTDNAISQVGEGIDSFGQRVSVRGNSLYQNYIFGIKLIHGASNSVVVGNEIIRPAKVGIVLAGSNSVQRDTSANQIIDNFISGVGQNSAINWRPRYTAGISLEANGSQSGIVVGNTIDSNRIANNGQMDFGVLCDVPHDNQISNLDLQGNALQEGLRDCS